MTDAGARDRRWLSAAIELAERCPPVERAYAVGAILVGADGQVLATGYSRETDPVVHAEEVALAKLDRAPATVGLAAGGAARGGGGSGGPVGVVSATRDLSGATLYTSLEPCSQRASRPRSCTQLIIDAGIGRVVLAWREPDLFVSDARGVELLTEAGVCVVELPELAEAARAVNAHLFR